MQVSTAVVPTAGFGTRFLPATKSVPKVLFPILDTPALQYAVEEAVASGIQRIVLVVSPQQEAIGAYFARYPELERALRQQGKESLLEGVRAISDIADVTTVRQDVQLGLGHAVLAARTTVGNQPFAVLLPDDVIWGNPPTIGRMVELFTEHGGAVVAVREVPDEMIPSLGVVDAQPMAKRLYRVDGMVEKPSIEEAPSNLAIVGRYVLPHVVFDALEGGSPGAIGEIQLTDAISTLLSTQNVYAYRFPGEHFDVGTPLGLLKASVHSALRTEEISLELREWIAGLV